MHLWIYSLFSPTDKIKSLENQIKDLKKQKESKKAVVEPSPKEQSQTVIIVINVISVLFQPP